MSDTYTHVHVGYPKTGTTTLQQTLFKKHPEIACINGITEQGYQEFRLLQTVDSAFPFDAAYLLAQRDKYRADPVVKCILLSDENILSTRSKDIGMISRRMARIFGPLKIIITLRNQYDLLKSMYANHGRFGQQAYVSKLFEYRPPFTFDGWLDYCLKSIQYSLLPILRYDLVLAHYTETFGPENVLPLLFEDFIRDCGGFVSRLCGFLGVDVAGGMDLLAGRHYRPAFTARRASLYEWRLRQPELSEAFLGLIDEMGATETLERHLDDGPSQEVGMSREARDKIHALYAQGNLALAERFGLDVQANGYPL